MLTIRDNFMKIKNSTSIIILDAPKVAFCFLATTRERGV